METFWEILMDIYSISYSSQVGPCSIKDMGSFIFAMLPPLR
jgi:hypothetical protein